MVIFFLKIFKTGFLSERRVDASRVGSGPNSDTLCRLNLHIGRRLTQKPNNVFHIFFIRLPLTNMRFVLLG